MLICVTASHKTASFELLERLSVVDGVAAALTTRNRSVFGAVVVATCNRFEAYLDIDESIAESASTAGATGAHAATATAASAATPREIGFEAAVEAISAGSGVEVPVLRASLDLRVGPAVAEHLFAVASGLESVVVGEGEIAGQVRRALETARGQGTTTSHLERLFQRASQTSRGVKNRTGIGSAGRSLVRLALDLAETRVSDWARTRILLAGTGRYAGACLAALRERGVADIRVFSPSGRAVRFAASHGIMAADAGSLAVEAASADIVITCTSTTEYVIDAALLTAGRTTILEPVEDGHPGVPAARPGVAGRQLLIDLGLPRNVNPDAASVDGVELLDLETIRLHAPLEELTAGTKAREIVGHAARKFAAVTDERSLAPAVIALRTHVYDALDAEIERAKARGDDGRTEAALRHLAGVLLHTPMVRAREHAREGDQAAFVAGLNALFGLEVATPAAAIDPVPIPAVPIPAVPISTATALQPHAMNDQSEAS